MERRVVVVRPRASTVLGEPAHELASAGNGEPMESRASGKDSRG